MRKPWFISQGPQNGLYKHNTDYGSGIPILRIDAFQNGYSPDFKSLKRVRLSPAELKLYGLANGDLLINRVNSRTHLGKSTLIENLPEPTVFESNMMRFRIDPKKIEVTYILHLLQSPFVNQQIQQVAKDASNQSSINQDDVNGFKIPVPPLPLQKKFAQLSARHTRLRHQHQAALDSAHHLFQSLLQQVFGDRDNT